MPQAATTNAAPVVRTVTAPTIQMPSNVIPQKLADAMRWTPTYHSRKMAIIFNFNKGSEAYLMCGKFLCDAHDKKDWKFDGSGATNWYQWVENELTQKTSNVKKIMSVWRGIKHLIETHTEILTQIEFSKLVEIVPHLKGLDEEQQVELVHMAGTNSVRDLRNNIREITGNGIPTDTCGHNGAMESWLKCPDCGKFIRVVDMEE